MVQDRQKRAKVVNSLVRGIINAINSRDTNRCKKGITYYFLFLLYGHFLIDSSKGASARYPPITSAMMRLKSIVEKGLYFRQCYQLNTVNEVEFE